MFQEGHKQKAKKRQKPEPEELKSVEHSTYKLNNTSKYTFVEKNTSQ